MNGYSLIVMVILIAALVLIAGVVSSGLINGFSRLSHNPFPRRSTRRRRP
jgi:hypothetical protein